MDITMNAHQAKTIFRELAQGDNLADRNLTEHLHELIVQLCFSEWNFARQEMETGRATWSHWYPNFHADMPYDKLLKLADWEYLENCLNENILRRFENDLKYCAGEKIDGYELCEYEGSEERLHHSYHFAIDRSQYEDDELVDDEVAMQAVTPLEIVTETSKALSAELRAHTTHRTDERSVSYGEVREMTRKIKENFDALQAFTGFFDEHMEE